jgi:hypothetical protein
MLMLICLSVLSDLGFHFLLLGFLLLFFFILVSSAVIDIYLGGLVLGSILLHNFIDIFFLVQFLDDFSCLIMLSFLDHFSRSV